MMDRAITPCNQLRGTITRRFCTHVSVGAALAHKKFLRHETDFHTCRSSNFLVYGSNGLKSDFGGHTHSSIGDIYAYIANCFGNGYQLSFINNTCVLNFQPTATQTGGYASDCNLAPGTILTICAARSCHCCLSVLSHFSRTDVSRSNVENWTGMEVHGNTVATPGGSLLACG